MTGDVRIRVKAPKTLQRAISGVVPSWCDVELFVAAPDGKETPLTGVKSIQIHWSEGSDPLTATLQVYVDECDLLVEASLDGKSKANPFGYGREGKP